LGKYLLQGENKTLNRIAVKLSKQQQSIVWFVVFSV